MDGRSLCEIIYKSCFEKVNPTIKTTKVDFKTPLVGFSGERSWFVGEFSLEITIGDTPLSRIKILNFVIVRSNSPHNMLLGRTTMQRMGIVVSTIHEAIKFHTEKGIGTALSTDKASEGTKRAKRIPATNDMVIKSTFENEMLKDIQETFERFQSINMKLNPKKCPFGVEEGPFLGHLITKHGIKANHSKVKAVIDLDQPRTLKDIQSLNGELTALSQFLSKGAKRSLAFFKILKGCKDKKSTQWKIEVDKALEKIKKLVQTLPTLTALRVGETLTMHLTISKERISVVLSIKRNERWTPIYFVSRVLQGAELNYPTLEKLVLALVHAARRLLRYFQAHTITVLTNTSIKQILTGPEKTGRVAKWAIELGEHDIVFLRREEKETPTDFLVEIPFEDNERKEKPKEVPNSSNKWRHYTDRASNSDGSEAGLMLIDPEGLRIAQEMEIAKVAIFLDSQLLIRSTLNNQLKKEKHFKEGMFANLCKGLKITQSFSPVTKHMEIMHRIGRQLTRSQYGWVDNLAKTLWIHRTLPRNSEKETSFSLTYVSEVVIPIIETTDDM
nr:hypothetical protein [Tanacetum cinerariifolium]